MRSPWILAFFLACGCGSDFTPSGPASAGGAPGSGGHETGAGGASSGGVGELAATGGAPAAGGTVVTGGDDGMGGARSVTCTSDQACATDERCVEPFPGAPTLRCAKPCAVADYSVVYDNCPQDGRACTIDADCMSNIGPGHCEAERCLKPCNKPLPSVPCTSAAATVCATIVGTRIVAPDCRRGPPMYCVENSGQLGHCGT